MHDPRFAPNHGRAYQADPTPARHTQTGPPSDDKGQLKGTFKRGNHLANAAGICLFGSIVLPPESLPTFLALVTGWQLSPGEITRTAERIAAIRQAFNLREGITPKDFRLQGRPLGDPPLKEGPLANVTIDADTLRAEYFKAMDWDPETGKPSKNKLLELGLDDVAKDLWP